MLREHMIMDDLHWSGLSFLKDWSGSKSILYIILSDIGGHPGAPRNTCILSLVGSSDFDPNSDYEGVPISQCLHVVLKSHLLLGIPRLLSPSVVFMLPQ